MRLQDLLKIRYPFIAGPMHSISLAPFVVAASEAGILGCLATAGLRSSNEFYAQLDEIRSSTNAPFAVNIVWNNPGSEDILEWCLNAGVKIIISSAGMPEKGIKRLKKAGSTVLQVVPSVSLARRAEDLYVDAVIVKGWESGGVNALDAVSTMVLLPQVSDALALPVIAAGGIGDGRGMAAAFALGAEGVLLGTRLLASTECPIHDCYKQSLIDSEDTGTISLSFPKFGVKFIKTEKTSNLKNNDDIWSMLRPYELKCDEKEIILSAGKISGMIREVMPIKQIVQKMIEQYNSTLSD